MVPTLSLWLPVLLSAAAAFAASTVIHMLLGYHSRDYRRAPDEDGLLEALRGFDLAPGDYVAPKADSVREMGSEEFRAKHERGPSVMLSVMPPGTGMSKQMTLWFVYCAVVSLFAGCVAAMANGPGAEYMDVFRFASATAFAGYALGAPIRSIWFGQSWGTTARNMLDGLIYALLTGGVFGWLWP